MNYAVIRDYDDKLIATLMQYNKAKNTVGFVRCKIINKTNIKTQNIYTEIRSFVNDFKKEGEMKLYYIAECENSTVEMLAFNEMQEKTEQFDIEVCKPRNGFYAKYNANIDNRLIDRDIKMMNKHGIVPKLLIPTYDTLSEAPHILLNYKKDMCEISFIMNNTLIYRDTIDIGVEKFLILLREENRNIYIEQDELLEDFYARLGVDLDGLNDLIERLRNTMQGLIREFEEISKITPETVTVIGDYRNLELQALIEKKLRLKHIPLRDMINLNGIPEEIERLIAVNVLATRELAENEEYAVTWTPESLNKDRGKIRIIKSVIGLTIVGLIGYAGWSGYNVYNTRQFLNHYYQIEQTQLSKLPIIFNKDDKESNEYMKLAKYAPSNVLLAYVAETEQNKAIILKGYCDNDKTLQNYIKTLKKHYKTITVENVNVIDSKIKFFHLTVK